MLDTHGRKFINPIMDRLARFLLRYKITPNQVTLIGLLLGLISSVFIIYHQYVLSCVFLWISGLFDVLDGTMARQSKMVSKWGSFMDILFDRVVEISIIIALGITNANPIALLVLTSLILLSMTIFLTAGALIDVKSKKSFYYQTGLAERTEGFIMFTLMILFPKLLSPLTYIFSLIIAITIIQRFYEVKRILSNN